jgi:hypothetical protein
MRMPGCGTHSPAHRQTGIRCPATCSDYALASARWLTVQIANIAGTTSARRRWHRAWVTVRAPVFLSLAQNLGEVKRVIDEKFSAPN